MQIKYGKELRIACLGTATAYARGAGISYKATSESARYEPENKSVIAVKPALAAEVEEGYFGDGLV